MALSTSRKNYGTGGSGVTTQGQILQHFLDSMDDIRGCLSSAETKESAKKEKFLLLVMYLRKLVPNRRVQEVITEQIAKKKREYWPEDKAKRQFSSEEMADYAAQLEALTEVMIYLNQGMDLIHNDAIAPFTRKAVRDAKNEEDRQKEGEPVKEPETETKGLVKPGEST